MWGRCVQASIQHVQRGKLVALGLAAARRSPYLPDIPVIAETIKDVEGAVISGVLAPAGTPRRIIDRLNGELAKASESARAKEIFAENAAEAMRMSPEELQKALERDTKAWAEVVQATGVKLN
jgi:tripartite-type tricarboxylate transporter receptor subunit TctC